MSLSFLIFAVRFLAVFLGLALLGLAISGTWALTCWITGCVQRRTEQQSAAAAEPGPRPDIDLHAREEGRS